MKTQNDRLVYLAALLDNARGVTDGNGAVCIGEESWILYLVKLYGGEHRTFTSKSGREVHGWFWDDAQRKKWLSKVHPFLRRDVAAERVQKKLDKMNAG